MLIIASAYSPEPTPITKQMAAHAGPERTCVRPLSRYAACGSAYVTGMIQLPAVYAVHFVRDRWLAIAPDQHAMHGQTFVRQELRAVDLSPAPRRPVSIATPRRQKPPPRSIPRLIA